MKVKPGILAIRGVTAKEKGELYRIAADDGFVTLSALLRQHIKKLIESRKKAA
jgi:hypothetical protein